MVVVRTYETFNFGHDEVASSEASFKKWEKERAEEEEYEDEEED